MKDYKAKQLIFHKLNKTDDSLEDIEHLVYPEMQSSEIIDYCKRYFLMQVETIFPAKSYAVAVIYAYLIEKYFGESILDSLKDKELFINTDKFFISYQENSMIYDSILKFIEENNLSHFEESNIFQVKKTVEYFRQEFLWQE